LPPTPKPPNPNPQSPIPKKFLNKIINKILFIFININYINAKNI